ncbi:multicopper oxidase family protein [Amycolatopsis oliviviridis]|uniref:Multicopper oxidase n=1 Tax=Amycolatopsis oliviviridis TaxID=1471590 RepID=A0ABQ3LWT3_9PSEU|nr:multicopper oxidase domain-containing protein [Amycolatopsis oliviviridis]GHH28282.1 multicopper oxidase [Amycolatopsis oliviviridis]
MLNRRDVLKLGSAAGAAMLFPAGRLASALSDDPPMPAPFSMPLSLPPDLMPVHRTSTTDFYEVEISETEHEILPGTRTRLLTYNGSFPGPTIRATRGRETVIRHTNRMGKPATVHLHGANVPASSDGHPLDPIAPGTSRVYRYPNHQAAATLWYHDHTHHAESEQVYRGLAGAYLLSDPVGRRLPLPSGRYDIPLLIRDAKFGGDGRLVYRYDDYLNRPTILVNGRPQPYLDVERRVYRLRLVNCSNLEPFRFTLTEGASFLQIASDGGFLPVPAMRREIDLWPSERAEVVVDFRSVRPGSQVVLENSIAADDLKRPIMQFRVGGGGPSGIVARASSAEGFLRGLGIRDWPIEAPPRRTPSKHRRFVLSADPNTHEFHINGRGFDPERVDATIEHGATEIWEIVNGDGALGIPHAMHLHLVQFQILDRNGHPEPSYDAYPKDTVRTNPGDVVRIQATFDGYTGRYPFHCHFMDHSSHSMMGQFEVVR